MDWSDLGKVIEPLAPILGGVLGGPAGSAAGAVVGGIIGKALGVDPTPESVAEAIKADPDGAGQKIAKAEADHGASIAEMEARMMETINATMREEMKSEGWLTRNWRPLHGVEFTAEMAGFAYLIGRALYIGGPTATATISNIMDLWVLLTAYGSARLAILGVHAHGRTQEKIASSAASPGSIGAIVDAVAKVIKK